MFRYVSILFFCVCLVIACSGIASAQSQTPVAATFFGASTSLCNPSICTGVGSVPSPWTPYWPATSSPTGVSIGTAGKSPQAIWTALDNDPSGLYEVPDGSAVGFHWRSCGLDTTTAATCLSGTATTAGSQWTPVDQYVNAAISSSVPMVYTVSMGIPQTRVCFSYSGTDYYGGPQGLRSGGNNPNAVLCGSSGEPNPFGIVYDTTSCPHGNNAGTGWCQGPGFSAPVSGTPGFPGFGDTIEFGLQLIDHDYSSYSTNMPIRYFEISNEPDAGSAPYWWQGTTGSSGRPDWEDLIAQSAWLEYDMGVEFIADGGNLGTTPLYYIGPADASLSNSAVDVSLCGSACSSASLTGFLNSTAIVSGAGVHGSDVINIGSFHLYPAFDATATPTPHDEAACLNWTSPFTSYTTIECTGNNLISDIQDRLNDFATYSNVGHVWNTEGSWDVSCDFLSSCGSYSFNPTIASDMRAYIARYSIIAATTFSTTTNTVDQPRQLWYTWEGNTAVGTIMGGTGTACDNGAGTGGGGPNPPPCKYSESGGLGGTPTYYAGYAYGQLIGWLAGGSIGACNTSIAGGCFDADSHVWSYPVTSVSPSSSSALIAWIWDNPTKSCSTTSTATSGCPNLYSYGHYNDLEGGVHTITHSTSTPVTLTIEPFLFY